VSLSVRGSISDQVSFEHSDHCSVVRASDVLHNLMVDGAYSEYFELIYVEEMITYLSGL